MAPLVLARLLLAAAPAAALSGDPFALQPAVLARLETTLASAGPGPAGAGSLERSLEGRDSRGRPCRADVDVRPPAVVRGRVERGWPEGSRVLVIQVSVAGRDAGGGAYEGAALFPPAPASGGGLDAGPGALRPVRTELGPDEVVHVESDAFTERRTRLRFRYGRLTALAQESRSLPGGDPRSFDCLDLRP